MQQRGEEKIQEEKRQWGPRPMEGSEDDASLVKFPGYGHWGGALEDFLRRPRDGTPHAVELNLSWMRHPWSLFKLQDGKELDGKKEENKKDFAYAIPLVETPFPISLPLTNSDFPWGLRSRASAALVEQKLRESRDRVWFSPDPAGPSPVAGIELVPTNYCPKNV
ncbi:hypothetical protein MG293_013788 [Ovis ammon polii]|uniref:Uncharacterized protein n=1 Tax=Ovis ammon polii TaxID=230172 RepID=A0AAD4Y7I0_OVIAM|nr:hypothetical protein MG293_013788 [Ovis ammon polii]KAI4557491.1 hypothetical protein MJT46_014170 [Ovis ammon polii x Ovis aries]